jgi:hypothetical protein
MKVGSEIYLDMSQSVFENIEGLMLYFLNDFNSVGLQYLVDSETGDEVSNFNAIDPIYDEIFTYYFKI